MDAFFTGVLVFFTTVGQERGLGSQSVNHSSTVISSWNMTSWCCWCVCLDRGGGHGMVCLEVLLLHLISFSKQSRVCFLNS